MPLYEVTTKKTVGAGCNRLRVIVSADDETSAKTQGIVAYKEALDELEHAVDELDRFSEEDFEEAENDDGLEDSKGSLKAIYLAAKGEVNVELMDLPYSVVMKRLL
jgi:hypothetical protein